MSSSMVWDPARVTVGSWQSVVEFYRHMGDRNHDFVPLRELAAHIASQPYAASLACATSGTALLVARGSPENTPRWARSALRVDVDFSGSIRVSVFDEPLGKHVTIECDARGAIDVFERVIRQAGWIG
jgi:hypothetical protein